MDRRIADVPEDRLNGADVVPLENKRNFFEVPGDIVERVDPIFFSDPR